jgi:hypothetical protein
LRAWHGASVGLPGAGHGASGHGALGARSLALLAASGAGERRERAGWEREEGARVRNRGGGAVREPGRLRRELAGQTEEGEQRHRAY